MFWSECFVQTLFCVNVGANISGQCWRASPISLFGLQLWQGSLLWAKGPEYPGYWHDATAIEHVWGSVRWQALPFVQAFYSCPLGLGGRASLPCLWNTFQGNFGSESSALVSSSCPEAKALAHLLHANFAGECCQTCLILGISSWTVWPRVVALSCVFLVSPNIHQPMYYTSHLILRREVGDQVLQSKHQSRWCGEKWI